MPLPYLTVDEASELLGMTAEDVHAAIDTGRLRAIRRDECSPLVPRVAIEAYRARRAGRGPVHPGRPPIAPLEERVVEFERHTGLDPTRWLRRWRADPERDTSESMRIAVAALALEAELADDLRSC